ncbi:MAG: hypothetical protein AAB849_02190 [Patescibacteria group bacterium]
MTDVLKIGKKALTVSVVFTTILWSIGFAALVAPLVVKADVALVAGDVIQGTSTKNVFYYSADGKRYTFPTDKVFFSWYKDWTVVKKIPDAQMGNITIGGTVAYKAGTQLVKIQTDPKVYAVEPGGSIRWIETEAIAKSLFGNDWAKKVHDVDPSIFPYVYKVGSSVNTASYPVGALVKVGSDYFYVNAANSKQKVSADVLAANGFQTKYAVLAANLDGYTAGADLAADATLKTVAGTGAAVGTGTGGTTTTTSGSGLTVSLASDQPVATTIVSDDSTGGGAQALIPVLKLSFTAAADGDAKVTDIKVKRGGVSADTDISNMYLFDGETRLISNPAIASNVITFSNSAGLFTVSKGTSKVITVKLDLKEVDVNSGKTLTFSVNASSDVVLASGTVSGTFPLVGSTFTTAEITDLAKLVWTSSSPSAAGTVDPGTNGFEIWRVQAANTNQDVEVRKVVFTLVGSLNVGDLKNFILSDGVSNIGSAVAEMAADKTITFDLSASPYLVTKGQTKILSLKTDVVGGTNRNFRATIQNNSDILQYDKGYNVFIKTLSSASSESFSVIEPNTSGTAVNYAINTGTLTQTLATDSPTGNIPDGATSVTLAKFNWKANGEDVKVSSLSVSSTCTGTCTSAGDELVNVRLLVDGSQVGTTIALLETAGVADTGWGTFGSSFIIKAGKTAAVKIVADTTDSEITGVETYTTGLVLGSSNAQGTVSLSSISTVAQNANALAVKTGTVTAGKNASFGNGSSGTPTGPVNASQMKVASLVITAGSGEAVNVSQIVLADNDTTNCIGDHLQNLTLKNSAGVQLGTTYANPSGTCTTLNTYSFNVSPAVKINAGAQYVVDVFADLKTALTTADVLIEIDSITATGYDTGTSASLASAADVALQQNYVSSAGAFMITTDSDTPVANNYLLGSVDQTIARFKIAASSTEAINISQLVVSSKLVTAATTGTWYNIRLYDNETNTIIGSAVASFNSDSTTATTTYEHAIFSGLSLNIAKGVSKVLVVKADATTYESLGLSTTGQTVEVGILADYYGTPATINSPITATGASSGQSITATVSQSGTANIYAAAGATTGGNAFAATTTLYRAKLTTAWATDTPSGASSPSSAQTVAKFVVTNLANSGAYTATVNYVNFDMSTTISQVAGLITPRAINLYKDSLSTTALGTSNFVNTATEGQKQTFGNTAFNDGGMTDVEIASGASKTFYVTLDTTDSASTKTLSIRMGSADIGWTDGIAAAGGITSMSQDLPLVWKTFTY